MSAWPSCAAWLSTSVSSASGMPVALAERGKPFAREADLARVICAGKAMEIGTNGVQLLGGHGFTKEHPVELWYRDQRAIEKINRDLGFLNDNMESEENPDRLSSAGRARLWQELWTLSYLGKPLRYS